MEQVERARCGGASAAAEDTALCSCWGVFVSIRLWATLGLLYQLFFGSVVELLFELVVLGKIM